MERGESSREAIAGAVVSRIAGWLAGGRDATPDELRFFASQLGDGGAITVQHVLDDDTHPEHEPLLDYLFSPDVALQQALEGILVAHGATCMKPDDTTLPRVLAALCSAQPPCRTARATALGNAATVVAAGETCAAMALGAPAGAPATAVTAAPWHTRRASDGASMAATIAEGQPCGMMLLRLPDGVVHVPLHGPDAADAAGADCGAGADGGAGVLSPHADGPLRTLLARLRLDRDVGQALAETLARVLPPAMAVAVRCRLRQSRSVVAAHHVAHMVAFVERMPASDPDFEECLALWLDVLENVQPDADPLPALAQRRNRLARSAREADAFSQNLARYSMETMMMQGMRPPALDAAEARRRVRLLDRVALAVCGRSLAQEAGEEQDLGTFNPDTALADLVRALS